MARGGVLSVENQLLAAKARALNIHAEGAFYDALIRLENLRSALDNLDKSSSNELFRYFPVAVVAVLESHFKATVQSIVDSGPPYLERGLALVKDRLKSFSEILPILHRKTITVGELVAHQLPFNSVASLEDALGELLGGKLKNMLSGIYDAYLVRNELEADPVIQDIEGLWRNLSETFERRHILAHEAATNYVVTWDQADIAVESAMLFTQAVDSALWATVWKDRPLTGSEMRDDAWRRYGVARRQLAAVLLEGRKQAKSLGRYKEFYKLHTQWHDYADRWVRWEEKDMSMGAIKVINAAIVRERLYRARMSDVASWCSPFVDSSVLNSN